MSLTAAQQAAVRARGNVLVVAGAGAGKTRTLVERCLDCLLRERPAVSLDELLVVTFTEAAAAEVRRRIRARLEAETVRDPARWSEQLALFDTACIGTLHSFCLQLVRQHFYELELDPQLAVLAEEEARLLAEETLDSLLQGHYAGRDSAAQAVQQLIQVQGRGSEQIIRRLVLRLHHYSQTLPDPRGWLAAQRGGFEGAEPVVWQRWLLGAVAGWRLSWLAMLKGQAKANAAAAACAEVLEQLAPNPSEAEAARALAEVLAIRRGWPRGNKTELFRGLKEFLAEAEFLVSLVEVAEGAEGEEAGRQAQAREGGPIMKPLAQDWHWVRAQMLTLLQLAGNFTAAFTAAKRELGVVDFHDLEQYALALLWDAQTNQAKPMALEWRRRLRFIFVDEYQDINAAQDKIIEALSRPGGEANRFLVGDMKQSIYRFRLANPHIFQGYVEEWSQGGGQVIPLVENFRSREGILKFVNAVFGQLMRPELGGVEYDERARLVFGAAAERRPLSAGALPGPCVELHVRLKGQEALEQSGDDAENGWSEVLELEEADKEARLLGLRLRELHERGNPVWEEAAGGFRPVRWRDMAVLLRAPARKADIFAKEFTRLGIPLEVARSGFYQNVEISDLLSLLQLLDNPLQDLPLLAVLHSPLVGLTVNELARIRLAVLKAPFWTALQQWARGKEGRAQEVLEGESRGEGSSGPHGKVSLFLERFIRWRRLARQVSLSRCLEAVLAETHYADWLLTQTRGQQRQANVQRLLAMAEQFDQFQRQGLFRFLRYIEAQQEAESEPEVALVNPEDAVRLMSIHQSKGLEFPVVAVADLGKRFNLSDLRAPLILDEEYGVCPQIKAPHSGVRYPSLPYWLACQRQRREALGEELRLLYVALTRARDALVLTGSISRTELERVWDQSPEVSAQSWLGCRSYTHWLGPWFAQHADVAAGSGRNELFGWQIYEDDGGLRLEPAQAVSAQAASASEPEGEWWRQLQERLARAYPFAAATRQPAKTSVSALRRRVVVADEESAVRFDGERPGRVWGGRSLGARRASSRLSAAEAGTAHHTFLRLVDLRQRGTSEDLRLEAERLQARGLLEPGAVACLDFRRLAAFWESGLGRKVRAQAAYIERELPFTARFPANELTSLGGEAADPATAGEFAIVQGVADLAVLLPKEIWLLDYKTDELGSGDLEEKVRFYAPQLQLYASALGRIYGRPVTHCWLYFLAGGVERELGVGPVNEGVRRSVARR